MALPRVGLALRANLAAPTFLLANHTLANQSPHALRTLYSTLHSAPTFAPLHRRKPICTLAGSLAASPHAPPIGPIRIID